MLKSFKLSFTPSAVPDTIDGANYDVDHFAAAVTGASWALTNTSTNDGLAHKISIRNNSATDHSAKTVTFTGKDENNATISETINLPAASPDIVITTKYFKTIESPLVPSATIAADTMDIGIAAQFTSQTLPMGQYYGNINFGTIISGVIDYDIDHTFNNVQKESSDVWVWLNNAMAGLTQNASGDFGTLRPYAIRAKINSYNTGATFIIIPNQSYN